MNAFETIGDSNQHQYADQMGKEEPKKSVQLNGDAAEFVPSDSGDQLPQTYGTFTLKIPLDSKIWKKISACSTNNHRITANRRPNPSPAKSFSKLQFNRTLTADIKSNGLICVRRIDNIYIDISLDHAIRVSYPAQKIHACISGSTNSVVVLHPNGRIFQNDSRVNLVAFDGSKQNTLLRYAKICHKGISFMAKDVPVVYLVDEGGLRSSTDHFIHIEKDMALEVFNNRKIRHTSYSLAESIEVVQQARHTQDSNGSEVIEIDQFRITSDDDGIICIERLNTSCCIRINPRKAAITLTSPHIHVTASIGKSPHLFVRQGDRRIHFDGAVFCVRNGGYSAGFDEKNQVTIFNKKCYPANVNN